MTQLRELLAHKTTGQLFRVVEMEGEHVWLMPTGTLAIGVWPHREPTSSIQTNYELVPEGKSKPLRKKAMDHADAVYMRFECALVNVRRLLTSKGRVAALEELRESDPALSPKVFYKVIRRWLEGGAVVPALAGQWCTKRAKLSIDGVKEMNYEGAVNQVRAQSSQLMTRGYAPRTAKDHTSTGSPRKRAVSERPTLFAVDKNALRVFLHFIIKHRDQPGSTLPARYTEMLDDVFATASPLGGSIRWPDFATPSFRQFEHWYYELTSFRDRSVLHAGKQDWNLNGRATLLQAVSAAYTAGAVGSLDATIWPVELVTDDDEARYIGPPVVFRIRDRDYGTLIGLAVSLETASWMGAATAIANCNEPKVAFCASLDIDIDEEDWPVQGLPAVIEADCGETHNSKPDAFITITRTDLKNLQIARGDLKPGVESDWHVLQVALCDMTPGAVIARYEQITMRKWRMQGRMTLRQFTRMLVVQELKKMHTIRPDLKLPKEMTAAGVDTSSLSMWNWSVANRGGGLRSFDHDTVRLSLLTIEKGSVTPDGLLFRGLLYIADELALAHAYERARTSRRRTVDVAFDSRLVDNVYIVIGDPKRPSDHVVCSLNVDRVDQTGLLGRTFREVSQIRKQQERQNSARTREVQPKISKWTAVQKSIADEATRRVEAIRASSSTSPSALEAARPAARKEEMNTSSPSQALRPLVDKLIPVQPPQHPSASVIPISTRTRRTSSLADRAKAFNPIET